MRLNLPPNMKIYLGIGGVLIIVVLLVPPGDRGKDKGGLAPPRSLGAAAAAGKAETFLEGASPVAPGQFATWTGELKARSAFKPLVAGLPPAAAPAAVVPVPPAPLPLGSLSPQPRNDSRDAPRPGAATPSFLYTGWYKVGGVMFALIEDLVASRFQYLREGESMGALTLVRAEPTQVVARIYGQEVTLAKTDEFVATPLNANAANSQTQRRGAPGGFGFGGPFGPGGFGGAGFGPGGFGQGGSAPGGSPFGGGQPGGQPAGVDESPPEPQGNAPDEGDRGGGNPFGRGGFRGRDRG